MPDNPTYAEVAAKTDQWIREKSAWLGDFERGRNKRPDHEIARKREDIRFLRFIRDKFAAAARERGAS